MPQNDIQQQLLQISDHYNALAKAHGYSHHAVQQSSIETQERRFQILLEGFPEFQHKKILDFGCGAGHLLGLLKRVGFAGEYVGYDLSAELLKLARENHPEGRFELRNILQERIPERFDLVFISGVFNNDITCNQSFLQDILRLLFAVTDEGLAFNCLSHYVDYKAEGLYYFNPAEVFVFCKEELTPMVSLRHDYEIKAGVVPFEFSCYLKQTAHTPRKGNYD